jgi:hypothetical protein
VLGSPPSYNYGPWPTILGLNKSSCSLIRPQSFEFGTELVATGVVGVGSAVGQ